MQNGQKVQEIASFKVSWFRKGDGMLYFLTVGKDTFVADPRFSLALKKPGPEDGNWCLRIHPTQASDDGTYLCQISTHPPTLLITHLQVIGEYLVSMYSQLVFSSLGILCLRKEDTFICSTKGLSSR